MPWPLAFRWMILGDNFYASSKSWWHEAQLLTAATLIMHPLCPGFPSPSLLLPGVVFQINDLPSSLFQVLLSRECKLSKQINILWGGGLFLKKRIQNVSF